jgi:four helix bundle protein
MLERRLVEGCNALAEGKVLVSTRKHMKYKRFEQLPVWKSAIDLAVQVYALTSKSSFKGQGSLRDQIERAAVSISSNIAEGFERGTTQELLTFLYIARGSAGEVRSLLCLLDRLPAFMDLKFEISNLKPLAESISRQLRAWADSLQETTIKGQRYLTEKARRAEKAARERTEFLEKLRRVREEGGKAPSALKPPDDGSQA